MSLSRRRFLGWLGAAGVGAAAGASGVGLANRGPGAAIEATLAGREVVPFYGRHQAGIASPQQAHLLFASVDVADRSRGDLRALFRYWTGAAARMTQGGPAAPSSSDPTDVQWDTGETAGLGPYRLTVTFGVGPTLFARDGVERFGLESGRPEALAELPRFGTDDLDPSLTGGDLCIQACADDEQVAFHAVRELLRLGHGLVSLRWAQAAFLPRLGSGVTPRNLLGFKDGTNNIRGDDPDALARYVWVGREGPAWLRGGSFLVARRINIRIDRWDGSNLEEQEAVIGRRKSSGAPLSGRHEHDSMDLRMTGTDGAPVIPSNAHVRVAAPGSNGGQRILRRPYSFVGGTGGEGNLEAGLFFLSYQRDPRTQFIPIQKRLSALDALNEYISHTGSGIFAMLPGVQPGGVLGRGLL